MKTVCVIPARGGSKRIPRKNIKDFMGKPVIAYSIEAAKESGLFTSIYVSTEDEEIGKVAVQFGAQWLPRRADLADSVTGTREVVTAATKQLWMSEADIVCCLYATSPLMDVADLKRGYNYLTNMSAEHAISVGYPPLQDAAQFYWRTVDALQRGIEYFDISTVLIPIKPERVIDINTPSDWERAEQMYRMLHGTRIDKVVAGMEIIRDITNNMLDSNETKT